MRNWILAVFAIVLLLASTASAAFVITEFDRGSGVPAVTGLKGVWTNSCAAFTWDAATGTDFNNFVVRTTSNNPEYNGIDTNMQKNSHTLCTVQDSQWVRAVVYRIDGNINGYFLNEEPDANWIVNPGTMLQAGNFLVFNILAALGALIGLIVLVVILIVLLKRLGFSINWFGRGK